MNNVNRQNSVCEQQLQQFQQEGYLVVKGLFSPQEVEEIKINFMDMHAGGPIEGCFKPSTPEEAKGDILKLYPRMMHPHRVNDLAFRYMIHPKVLNVLELLFGEEALAAQSMFYFKPPGAKGRRCIRIIFT